MVAESLPHPSASAHLPEPGSMFAGHMVESEVGRGGMGVVFRARQPRLGRVVALKVVCPELLADDAVQQRFLEEAITAASIEHPNVVPVHDAGEADGVAYMVMRYVPGTDLRTLVRAQGPLPVQLAAEITAKVADALDALHRAGYVHRDVKPRNVLVAAGGHVYLSDFGLARPIDACPADGGWVGTVAYAAPEQITGHPTDPRSDVYGLGGLLYFALTGRPPFERDSLDETLRAHLSEAPPAPSSIRPGLPPEIDAVVVRALAKEPASRFATAGEMARAAQLAA